MQQEGEVKFYESTQKNEKAFLGAILLENSLMAQALEHLDKNSFVIGKHRAIFAAMVELSKRQEDINPENIVREVRVHYDLDKAGGESYIRSLIDNVPSVLTIWHDGYIERFALISIAMSITAAAFSDLDSKSVANLISEKLSQIERLREEIARKQLTKKEQDGLSS